MTTKDYELIANAFHKIRREIRNEIMSRETKEVSFLTLDILGNELCNIFKNDNTLFNRTTFCQVAGIETKDFDDTKQLIILGKGN